MNYIAIMDSEKIFELKFRFYEMKGLFSDKEISITILDKKGYELIDCLYTLDINDVLIIDYERLLSIRNAPWSRFKEVYIYYFSYLVNMRDTKILKELAQYLLKKKKYTLLKNVNKLISEINCCTKQETMDGYPLVIQIESTSFCNAQCIMCQHIYSDNHKAQHMDKKMLKKLEQILPYTIGIILHGNGEPFIAPGILDQIRLYHKYGLKVTTNTNMSILNDALLDEISHSFESIGVSCDGCTKEIYEGIRGNLKFEPFVENVKKLRARCPNLYLKMCTIVMRQNIYQLVEMVQFAHSLKFNIIVFSHLGTNPIIGNEKDSLVFYPATANHYLKKAVAEGNKLGIEVVIPDLVECREENDPVTLDNELKEIQILPMFPTNARKKEIIEFANEVTDSNIHIVENLSDCKYKGGQYSCKGICEWPASRIFIDLKGNVYVCCITATFKVGNIYEVDNFMEIWNNEIYKSLRREFYAGRLPRMCRSCQFILNHSMEDRLEVFGIDDYFYIKEPIGNYYQRELDKQKKKIAQQS